MLAFSTCWNAHRHENGEHLINEVLLLGFEAVELSHRFTRDLLPGFRKGFDQGRLKVSGARHPFPARAKNENEPAVDLLSPAAATRTHAIQQIMASINQADSFGGSYLILSLEAFQSSATSDQLLTMRREGDLHSRRYVAEKLALIEAREQDGAAVMPWIRAALHELVPYAEPRGVRLVLENRARYEQFPTVREIEALLAEFPSQALGYWHDFGHAERQAQLGFLDHAETLERLGPRLIGCHVHDLVWPDRDHAIPGQGMIDFAALIPRLPKQASVVWEIESRRKTNDIKAALALWREKFPES